MMRNFADDLLRGSNWIILVIAALSLGMSCRMAENTSVSSSQHDFLVLTVSSEFEFLEKIVLEHTGQGKIRGRWSFAGRTTRLQLDEKVWELLMQTVDQYDIWNMSTSAKPGSLGGLGWAINIQVKGKRRNITRFNPELGQGQEHFCQFIRSLRKIVLDGSRIE